MNMSIFRRSRVAVVSQSNRNCDVGFNEELYTPLTFFLHKYLLRILTIDQKKNISLYFTLSLEQTSPLASLGPLPPPGALAVNP